ncbi:MAG TPA: GNAT family N-acetyltransferase [Candidatus Kapabacteria bacterium]|nr:GNAT family N-acetyltransferase [Candidatus Kapabacteria bacterium]
MNRAERSEVGWTIRRALSRDATPLSEVAARIFNDTFASSNSAEDMELYRSQTFTPAAMAAEMEDPDADLLVAVCNDAIVAYAQLHFGNALEIAGPGPWAELKRFYVLASMHGSGLAQELMRAVAERAHVRDAATLWLGVWEHNARAIRFYSRLGFREVGEQPFMLGNDLQRDLIMAAPVSGLHPAPGLT